MAVKWTEEQEKVITLRDRNHDIYKGGSRRDERTY